MKFSDKIEKSISKIKNFGAIQDLPKFMRSDNVDVKRSLFYPGYDFESKELVTIIGNPFQSNRPNEVNKARKLIKDLGLSISSDILSGYYSDEELEQYYKECPFSCYIMKRSSAYLNRVELAPFDAEHVVALVD